MRREVEEANLLKQADHKQHRRLAPTAIKNLKLTGFLIDSSRVRGKREPLVSLWPAAPGVGTCSA